MRGPNYSYRVIIYGSSSLAPPEEIKVKLFLYYRNAPGASRYYTFQRSLLISAFKYCETVFREDSAIPYLKFTDRLVISVECFEAFEMIMDWVFYRELGNPVIFPSELEAGEFINCAAHALALADYLQLCHDPNGFVSIVLRQMRNVLCKYRGAVNREVFQFVFVTNPTYTCLDGVRDLFADAAVKPFLHTWMLFKPISVIAASAAITEANIGYPILSWVQIVYYFDTLARENATFRSHVLIAIQKSMINSKRLYNIVTRKLQAKC
jgi:hypothetical protein